MELSDGYIVNPEDFRVAPLVISPFTAADVFKNRKIWLESDTNEQPEVELLNQTATVTTSGTRALELVVGTLELNGDDEVWIVTTSGNSYVSGCVTRTIEKVCRWSLEKSKKSKAILVIHEFGFVYDGLEELTKHNLPIIEDCAYSMYSSKNGIKAGTIGDFAIYSMAKMFPVQSGGLIVSKEQPILDAALKPEVIRYLRAVFNFYSKTEESIVSQRLRVYDMMISKSIALGLTPRFILSNGEVPGAFVFVAKGVNLPHLKVFMQSNGVECSVFYGEDAFYLPCHQNMDKQHVHFLSSLIRLGLKKIE